MDIIELRQFSRAIPKSGIYLKAAFLRKITVINVEFSVALCINNSQYIFFK